MKNIVGTAALLLVSLLVAGVVAELVVRLTLKDRIVMFPRYHAAYQYGPYRLRGIRPHAHFWHTSSDGSWAFTTNGKGLRDAREFAYAKPAGTLRVLALGDSNTQGYEVGQDATFAAVLERYLV